MKPTLTLSALQPGVIQPGHVQSLEFREKRQYRLDVYLAKAGSLELHLNPSYKWRGPKDLSYHYLSEDALEWGAG